MFYHYTNFTDFLTEDQAKLCAKRCNEVLNNQGHVVYGNQTEDGHCLDFNSEKMKIHTHVGILLGVEVMGSLKPSDKPLKLEKPTEQDFNRAMADKIKYLEAENKNLRKQNGRV